MVEFKIQLEESEKKTLSLMGEIEMSMREVKAIRKGKISDITFEDLEKENQIRIQAH